MKKTSVQLFFSPVVMTESRLLKSSASLLSLNLVDKIFIIGYWTAGLKEKENVSEQVNVIRIKTLVKSLKLRKGIFRKFIAFLSLIQFYMAALFNCLRIRPTYISCHTLPLLPLSVFIKWIIGSTVIYEPHELETERAGINKNYKKIFRSMEKRFIGYADKVITVCEPISQFYKEKYNLNGKVFTIRNIPINPRINERFPKNQILRFEFNIPQDSIIYIYQGLIDKHRGILNYLQTFSKLSLEHHLVLMGYGEEEQLVRDFSDKYANIHFKEAVPISEIIKYTSSADIGLFVLTGQLPLSYTYSLPNKFYEYVIAGLHICVSDNLKYLSELVNKQNLGSVIGSSDTSLYEWIIKNNWERKDIIPSDENYEVRKSVGWQNEENVFKEIY